MWTMLLNRSDRHDNHAASGRKSFDLFSIVLSK
jgi:hypothetical protein